MNRRDQIQMTDGEISAFLAERHTMSLATMGRPLTCARCASRLARPGVGEAARLYHALYIRRQG
jgi:hypothetical protein